MRIGISTRIGVLALLGCVGATFAANEVEAFLRLGVERGKIEPVGAGIIDTSVPTPAGWFPIRFTGQSVNAATSWLLGGGASVGRPIVGDFSFAKNVDFASPALLRAILGGSGFTTAELVIRKAGTPQGPFYSVLVKDVFVRGVTHAGTSGAGPAALENVALTYKQIEWSYHALDAKGTVVFESTINWDQVQGVVTPGLLPDVQRQVPFVAPDQFVRLSGNGVAILILALLANDAPDAAFDPAPPFSTTAGGKIAIADGQLIYTPPSPDNRAEDQFSYSVRNQAGARNSATVTIGVRTVTSPNLNLTLSEQNVAVHLAAEAGLRYQLQVTARLDAPWADLQSPVIADEMGRVNWIDTLQGGTRYYRAFVVP